MMQGGIVAVAALIDADKKAPIRPELTKVVPGPGEDASSADSRKRTSSKSSKNPVVRREPSGPQLPSMGTSQKNLESNVPSGTVVRLLDEKGYVLKVPQPWPDRQDEVLREQSRRDLSALVEDEHVEVWYEDETGVQEEPKPRVVHNGDHIRLNILGAVCPRTGEFFATEASHCDTDVFQAFLDEAARSIAPTRKRNILILDNASWHKRKRLNWHFFEPLPLPPYSPDLNPIERIWLIMKAEYFSNIHCRNKAALLERADQALCALMDNPAKVSSAAGSFGN
jgi:transposase